MKRYYYNNWLAKVLLHFSTSHTIALAWFVLSKLPEEQTSQRARNHETIHAMQWTEVTMAVGAIIFILIVAMDISVWYLMISPFFYYGWYIFEWLYKLPQGNAYHKVSFEREAYAHDEDLNYVENRRMFSGWISRI